LYDFNEIRLIDPEIAEAIENETNRQKTHIELIASEKPDV
jgi:glycine hydroxymethyltransferase